MYEASLTLTRTKSVNTHSVQTLFNYFLLKGPKNGETAESKA